MGEHAMKRILIALMFGLVLQPAVGRAADPPLYQRLGGYDAIAAVTDDFLGRLARDPSLGRFFVGHGTDSIHRIQQDIMNFLCKATGGPCLYTARDMKTAHAGLGITGADWDRMLVQLNATFNKFKVPERERNDVLTALAGLRKDIVEQ
jgi:hemoglobin